MIYDIIREALNLSPNGATHVSDTQNTRNSDDLLVAVEALESVRDRFDSSMPNAITADIAWG